jgi:threonine dehydratase
MSAAQRQCGVIAASAGNHALALAHHGRRLGIPVTVVMPQSAPLIKQERCRQAKAEVILHGDSFESARRHAADLARQRGLTYVHGYDDPAIIAGQGTIGCEILEQVPDADALIVPIGGAGLIAGISLVVKELQPRVKMIGVEPRNAASFWAAKAAGRPVPFDVLPTLADGLAVNQVGDTAFALAQSRVDQLVLVDEQSLAIAVVRLMELDKSVVEGAGAAPLAALMSGQLAHLAGKRVVLLLCGSNIDLSILNRLIEIALVASGRLTRFVATISDRPGGLARFASLVAETGASIKEVSHDRDFAGPDVTRINVFCTVETRNESHIHELFQRLAAGGIHHRRLDLAPAL